MFEPVCTHPAHRRLGLARTLILEGMRRLHDLGALTADVESGDGEVASTLYRECGFSEEYHAHVWRRRRPAENA
jgi:ribosomal protein S18 acetylase RimI-like enzyme